jgi:hypothetical protein
VPLPSWRGGGRYVIQDLFSHCESSKTPLLNIGELILIDQNKNSGGSAKSQIDKIQVMGQFEKPAV